MPSTPNEELGCAAIALAVVTGVTLLIWALAGFPAFWK